MRWPVLVLLLSGCLTERAPSERPDSEHPDSEHPDSEHPDSEPPDREAPYRVFVSRGAYRGALAVDDLTGLAAADRICALRAKAAGLGGSWVAWLSSSTENAIDRVKALGPWQLVGGEVAFDDRAQLYGEPSVPLYRDERGESLSDASIWTGTQAGGLHAESTCDGWTSTESYGMYGHSAATFAWTDYSVGWCNEQHHLLCIEI